MLKVILINLILIFFLLEVSLRIFWTNPYVSSYENAYFHEPNVDLKFSKINKLYNYKKKVTFRTGKYGNIKNGINDPIDFHNYAIVLGGSSTESALVPEGKRWPDLLNIPTLNFGKSRLNTSHSVKNLEYIINEYNLTPSKVFVMDGVNNLHNFIYWGKNGLSKPDFSSGKSLYKFILKNYYTSAFFFSLVKRSDYYLFYKIDVERRKMLPKMTDEDFEKYWGENKDKMYDTLMLALSKIKDLSRKNNIEVHILTQPHAYDENYNIYNEDLRVTPIINNKSLSIKQSRTLMQYYNKLTTIVAKDLSLNFHDISACFESTDTSDLLYDAFHFTIEGSEFFAECLNAKL